MNFSDFASLEPAAVAELVLARDKRLGVALPMNGTRRWYVDTFHIPASMFLDHWQHYQELMLKRLLELAVMMFQDGITAFYTPLVGRAMLERGPAYMKLISEGIAVTASEASMQLYRENQIEASCYGEVSLLPEHVQNHLKRLESTKPGMHYLRYGVMADKSLPDLIARTVRLSQATGCPPTDAQLLADYYHGESVTVGMWIGSDQPTVFDVPGVVNEHTALYFLQFPTPYLDRQTWRRLLYDYLFVRGDEETLYPENISNERRITGLGMRNNGYWIPSEV